MKQYLFKILSALILCLWLSGCNLIDFSEDCFYTGDVEVIFDWQSLYEGDSRPDVMQTTFYPQNSALTSFLLAGDTILTGLAASQHDVLTYNLPPEITFHDTDCPCTAYASLSTYTKNGKVYTINASALYAAKRDITIPAFGRTLCELSPKPCFQQVYIDFVIIRNNVEATVETLSGEINGVATKYSFGDMQQIRSEALLPFNAKQMQADKFHTALRVLGMNPTQKGQAEITKDLAIALSLTDGRQYAHNLDLTSVFAGFTAPAIYLTIEIRLSALGIDLSIADWYTGEGGKIDI